MPRTKSRLTGFREASAQLNNMKKSVARGVGRRALKAPAQILCDEMIARAAVLTSALRSSIKLVKERADRGRPRIGVIADDPAAVPNEFGTLDMNAQPFARPAKDAKAGAMLDAFGAELKADVDRTIARQIKREAKG